MQRGGKCPAKQQGHFLGCPRGIAQEGSGKFPGKQRAMSWKTRLEFLTSRRGRFLERWGPFLGSEKWSGNEARMPLVATDAQTRNPPARRRRVGLARRPPPGASAGGEPQPPGTSRPGGTVLSRPAAPRPGAAPAEAPLPLPGVGGELLRAPAGGTPLPLRGPSQFTPWRGRWQPWHTLVGLVHRRGGDCPPIFPSVFTQTRCAPRRRCP